MLGARRPRRENDAEVRKGRWVGRWAVRYLYVAFEFGFGFGFDLALGLLGGDRCNRIVLYFEL